MKLVPSFSIEKTSIAAQLRCMRIEKLGSSNEKTVTELRENQRCYTTMRDDMLLTVSSTQYKMGHYTAAD